MRTPLIRQGEGQNGIHRIYDLIRTEMQQVDRMIRTATSTSSEQASRASKLIGNRSGEGDQQRLRGIPAIAAGVPGTQPGTDPLREAILAENRRERTAA